MAAFVIDASATLPWCFADEATDATNALLTRLQAGDEALVPAHWPAEVANALLVAVRRRRISPQDARQFLENLDVLPIRIETMTQKLVRLHILPLAEAHNLTIYDASYLELAMRQTASLATLDDHLRKAARASGVPLLAEPQP
ncbi:MAG: type II toxin-antitoxin system VapC family toxin [Terriglobia bacterium]